MHATNNTLTKGSISTLTRLVGDIYESAYPEVKNHIGVIRQEIETEVEKFGKTLSQGIKQFEKISHTNISGKDAFILFSSYGFPFEITKELAKEKGIEIDEVSFNEELLTHQEKSRTATAGKFKGGLAGHGEMETKYHTATHLLNTALRKMLGRHVGQKGSNINSERLRFDFSHGEKLTSEQKEQVENDVNEAIKADLPVSYVEMSLEEARALGAVGVFGEKYPDIVKVYTIGNSVKPWSREICGGPHVEHTGILGTFKIAKEEAVSQGVRRIKAVLE